jgi:hypothetical protein
MTIRDIVKKLANLLYKDEGAYEGVVCFDWSSYDFDEDIPYITIDGKEFQVEVFSVNETGTEITVSNNYDKYIIDLSDETLTEEKCDDMGIYTLLSSVYYETDYSWEFGDFETDFLGINC